VSGAVPDKITSRHRTIASGDVGLDALGHHAQAQAVGQVDDGDQVDRDLNVRVFILLRIAPREISGHDSQREPHVNN